MNIVIADSFYQELSTKKIPKHFEEEKEKPGAGNLVENISNLKLFDQGTTTREYMC